MAEQGAGKWGSMVKAKVLAPAKLAFESTNISAKISFPSGGLALNKGGGEGISTCGLPEDLNLRQKQKVIIGAPFFYECLSL